MTEQRVPADTDASWAPTGWEPGDIGFDDAPFGSVLGDPLMGSPIFDVSVLDAAPGSDAADAQKRPAAPSGAARRTTTRPQHQQATQRPSHRPSTTRPQPKPSAPSPLGDGVARTPAPSVPNGASGDPYAPRARMPQQRNQSKHTGNIEKLVTAGIGWVVFILLMIIFASM